MRPLLGWSLALPPRLITVVICLGIALAHSHAQTTASDPANLPRGVEHRATTVGIEGRMDVLLPLPELKAKESDRRSPLTLRIASTRPHGTLVQYDLRYIGLVPGNYDLRQYLLQPGGRESEGLPPLMVQVVGVLPEQHAGTLTPHGGERFASLGGYQWLMGAAIALWALAAIPLLLARRRRPPSETAPTSNAPPTLAERLRPMVELASTGQLTTDQQAQLERMLLSHWRRQLHLESLALPEAMCRLREHPEAGALLRGLEDWLHRPPGSATVDIEGVLAPYRHAQSDEVAPPDPAGGAQPAGVSSR